MGSSDCGRPYRTARTHRRRVVTAMWVHVRLAPRGQSGGPRAALTQSHLRPIRAPVPVAAVSDTSPGTATQGASCGGEAPPFDRWLIVQTTEQAAANWHSSYDECRTPGIASRVRTGLACGLSD